MKATKALLAIALLYLSTCLTSAQDDWRHTSDSIRNVIAGQQGDERLASYDNLSATLYFDAPLEEFMQFFKWVNAELEKQEKQADSESEKRKYIEKRALFHLRLVRYLHNNHENGIVEDYAAAALKYCRDNEVWDVYYSIHENIARTYTADKMHEAAEALYREAQDRNHPRGLYTALRTLALAYSLMNKAVELEQYYRECLDLVAANDWPDRNSILHNLYSGLSEALRGQEKFDEAQQLLKKWEALIIEDERQGERMTSEWYNYYGKQINLNIDMLHFDEAEKYCDLADSIILSGAYAKRYSSAIQFKRAWICFERKDYARAYEFARLSEEGQLTAQNAFSNAIVELEAKSLVHLGRADDAIAMYDTLRMRTEQLFDTQIAEQLQTLRTRYEVDKHIAEKEKARLSFRFAAGIGALLLVILIIWFFYSRKIHKKNVALVDQILAQEKDGAEIDKLRKIAQENAATLPETDEIFARLEKLMQEQRPYTKTDCNRKTLAEAIGTNEKYLSESIKNNTDLSVNEYIVKYRLKHANTLLLRPAAEYTIDAVAIDSGFGSRSNFHEHYRTNYGITPNEFRKTIQEEKG